jgi:UDP-N-acetylglucosamine 2-epimerase
VALATFYLKVPIEHVEAGIGTRGSIIQSVLELMDNVSIGERMGRMANPFTGGHASERIVQSIPGGWDH